MTNAAHYGGNGQSTQTKRKEPGIDDATLASLRLMGMEAPIEAPGDVLPDQRIIGGFMMVPRERLVFDENVRTGLLDDPDDLQAFGDSVKALKEMNLGIQGTGILQPLTVEEDEGRPGFYFVRIGNRRGLATIPFLDELPVITSNAPTKTVPIMQMVENLQRRDMKPRDVVFGLQLLNKQFGMSSADLERLFQGQPGHGRGWVGLCLAAARVDEDLHYLLDEDKSRSYAVNINPFKEPELRRLLKDLWPKSVGANKAKYIARVIDPVKEPALRSRLIREARKGASVEQLQAIVDAAQPKTEPTPDATKPFSDDTVYNSNGFSNGTSNGSGITTSRTTTQHYTEQPAKTVQTTIFDDSKPLIPSADVPRYPKAFEMLPETVGNLPDKGLEAITTFISQYQEMDQRGDWTIERKRAWEDTFGRIIASAEFARDMVKSKV